MPPCRNPECDESLPDSVMHDKLEASEDDATPYFTRVYDSTAVDMTAVQTSYYCSPECVARAFGVGGEE